MIDRISRLFRRNEAGNDTTATRTPAAPVDPVAETQRVQQLLADTAQRCDEIARLSDPAALLELALNDKVAKVRLAAAEKLTAIEDLERLRRDSTDKAVQRHVRDTLKAMREQEQTQLDARNRIDRLLEGIAQHAGRSLEPLYEAKLDSLCASWREVGATATAADQEKFAELAALCRDTIGRHAAELAAREQAITAKQELIAACGELETTVKRLAQEDLSASAAAVTALLSTQQTRWDEAATHTTVDAPLAARFRQAARTLDRWLAAISELAHAGAEAAALFAAIDGRHAVLDAEDATAAAEQAETDAHEHRTAPAGKNSAPDIDTLDDWQHRLDSLRARIDWPQNAAPAPLLAELDDALHKLAKKRRALQGDVRQQVAQLRKRRQALKHMIDEGQLRVAARTHHWLQKRIAELPAREAAQETAALAPVAEALAKLHDWYEFASVPKKTELCERIEALAAISEFHDTGAVAARAEQVRGLRERWNALCAADPEADPELRSRFDRAAGLAFAPCAAWYDAQHRQQDANLAQRLALCDTLAAELATLTATPPADIAAWRALDQHERELRARWKTLEPVRWPEARASQDRFHTLLGELRTLLAGERKRNAAAKRALIERAHALIAHEPLAAALGNAKTLQEEWKHIGWTDPRDDRTLWQKFRTELDAVFARREHARDAERAAREAERAARAAEAAEAERKRAEETAKRAEREQAVRAARQAEIDTALALADAESQALAGTATGIDALRERIENLSGKSPLLAALRERSGQLAGDTTLVAAAIPARAAQLAELTLELEILLDLPSPPELAQARMQAKIGKLNNALRHRGANAAGGKDGNDPRRALEDAWLAIGPLPADLRAPLLERFRRVLAH